MLSQAIRHKEKYVCASQTLPLNGDVWLSTLVGPLTSGKDPWWAHTRSEGFENRKGQLPRRESSQDSCVVPFIP
jgi:hypothetical protein